MSRLTGARRIARTAARIAGQTLLVAIAGGVTCGLAARLLMRWVAVSEAGSSSFSAGATLGIIIVFIVVTVPFALAHVVRRRAHRGIGIVHVTVLAVLSSPQALSTEPGADTPLALLLGNRLLFVALYVGCAVGLGRFADLVTGRVAPDDNGRGRLAGARSRWVARRLT
jgi:hypothetical protein